MYRILLIEIRLGSHNSPKYSLRNSFFRTGPEIVDSNEFEDSTFLSSPGFTSRRVKNWNPPRRLVHASIQRRKRGTKLHAVRRAKDGISVDREYRGSVGDIASAIHDENFSKGSNKEFALLCCWRLCSNRRRSVWKKCARSCWMENYFFIFNNFEYFRYCLKSVYSARFFCAANDSFWRVVVSMAEIVRHNSCSSLCAIYSSGITLFRERVLHDASSGENKLVLRVSRDRYELLFIFYISRYVYWFRATILYFTPRLRSCRVIRLQHGCNEKLSLL